MNSINTSNLNAKDMFYVINVNIEELLMELDLYIEEFLIVSNVDWHFIGLI